LAIKFSPDTMTCGASSHTAHQDDAGTWAVSYLPGRVFTRSEAITALNIAEAAVTIDAATGEGDGATWDRLWPHVAGWADELGISPTEAFGVAVAGDDEAEQADAWCVQAAEGTAVGPSVPVVASGAVFAVLTALWSDSDGVRVSIDWQAGTDDMSAAQALALAEALRMVAGVSGPEAVKGVPEINRP
jgi:hypothetical protein